MVKGRGGVLLSPTKAGKIIDMEPSVDPTPLRDRMVAELRDAIAVANVCAYGEGATRGDPFIVLLCLIRSRAVFNAYAADSIAQRDIRSATMIDADLRSPSVFPVWPLSWVVNNPQQMLTTFPHFPENYIGFIGGDWDEWSGVEITYASETEQRTTLRIGHPTTYEGEVPFSVHRTVTGSFGPSNQTPESETTTNMIYLSFIHRITTGGRLFRFIFMCAEDAWNRSNKLGVASTMNHVGLSLPSSGSKVRIFFAENHAEWNRDSGRGIAQRLCSWNQAIR
ncbi:MAG: hypothetical protein M5R36_09835 [Deltaproteobacteria bacterium]|nr:hypothetical protein [Deltaproteobacteria bacterium]